MIDSNQIVAIFIPAVISFHLQLVFLEYEYVILLYYMRFE